MKPKVSYMLVGLFVLGLGAALVATVVWLSTATGDKTYGTYVTYMAESVSGLSVNGTVSYNGVAVGKVVDIALDLDDPGRVRIELEIEEGTPVKTDTVARLASSGITGVAHVELSGGTPEADLLEAAAGQDAPIIASTPSLFVRLDQSISGLVDELTGAATSLTSVANRVEALLDEENEEAIGGILANVEAFTNELEGIAAEVSMVTGNVAAATAELPVIVDRAEDTLLAFEASAVAIEGAGTDISATAEALQASVAGVADGVDRVLADLTPFTRGAPARFVHLVDELELLASSLRRLAQDVERNPEMLLFGRRDVVRGPGE